jgi:hypothetical protein
VLHRVAARSLGQVAIAFHGESWRLGHASLLLLAMDRIRHGANRARSGGLRSGMLLRCRAVKSGIAVSPVHSEVDVHHLLVVLFLRLFPGDLLVKYATDGSISTVHTGLRLIHWSSGLGSHLSHELWASPTIEGITLQL